MKAIKPSYFDEIQKKAEDRWKGLESDPEESALWQQLFKQVQSPRHIISELLQNADDAQATEVSVEIIEGVFTFSHDGRDFSGDEFASLCRFAYSNKRVLHTTGFRGIGFKSTFSLGDIVELITPTLRVAFHKKRFTYPVWLDSEAPKDNNTRIFIKIADDQRQQELMSSLRDWLDSPFSLLFFNNIRRLKLGEHDLHWANLGTGPIPNSTWMGLQGKETPYLVVRSLEEPFPEEAIREISDERLIDLSENISLLPSKLEIVLGAPGQLFNVLPTGVRTPLPFALNASFVQDPARLKIKDPETSPTNRWLLQRIGQLAADAMLLWLKRRDLDITVRAKAYDLLSAPDQKDNSLESVCAQIVSDATMNALQGKAYLLNDNGNLEMAGSCISLPSTIWDIWTNDQIVSILFAKFQNPLLLSNSVSQLNNQKLQKYNALIDLEINAFLDILTVCEPPKPASWSALLGLWELVSEWNRYYYKYKDIKIHPVRGRNFLHAAENIVRLGEKRLLQSEDDWDFLASNLLVIDVNWLRYLTEQRRIATESFDKSLGKKIDNAERLLQRQGLDEASNLDVIIEQVATDFFKQNPVNLGDCVRFTQIAAKLNAKIGNAFRYAAKDRKLHPIKDDIFFDNTGMLDEYIPPNKIATQFLHEEYSQLFQSCTKEEWSSWINTGNAGIKTFVPLHNNRLIIYGDHKIEQEVKFRSYMEQLYYPYVTSHYEIEDWDFPTEYWSHWKSYAQNNPMFWGHLVERFLDQPKAWENNQSARVYQIATTGSRKSITQGTVLPTWIMSLRELPCLRDTRGNYCRPSELMRRTPQTEPLLDVEPFVDAHLDFEAARPLLDLLGVRNTPTGPRQILERLRALAKAPKPPLLELTKWYQRLDALYDDCSTEDQLEIKFLFHNERLIFTEDGSWQNAKSAFIASDENEAPNAALIHSEANHLSLWRKIGVNERPTVGLAIEWLKHLPSGKKVLPTDIRRIQALLGRHPIQIWQECRHWLNLAGEWVPVERLKFSLTMQPLIRWANFHDWVKEETANLTMLSLDIINKPPFDAWTSLASQVEKRIEKTQRQGQYISLNWLQSLGRILMRIRIDDHVQTLRIRDFAARLADTEGQHVEAISVLPYLNDKPAGLPEHEKLAWIDQTIYITDMSKPKLVRQISEIIATSFDWLELKSILSYSFERSEKDIYSYLNENFTLDPEEVVIPIQNPNEETEPATETTSPARAESPNEPVLQSIPETNNIHEPDIIIERGNQEIPNIPPTMGEIVVLPEELKPTQPPRPPQIRISLIECFAQANGFYKNGSNNFVHNNGNILIKTDGVFPWLIQEPAGTVVRHYWIKEHCLQNKPLELPTEIWHFIEQDAQHHALILEDTNGNPIEMHGIELLNYKEDGKLKLFPATYRLTLAMND